MAAPTITLSKATANRCVFKVVADNSGTAGLLTNAQLLAAMAPGPVLDAYNKTYATDGISIQSAMRTALEGGNLKLTWQAFTGLGVVQPDVDVDAVSVTKPEIDIVISAATVSGYLFIEHWFSMVR